jgi:hypothetical protein
MDFGHLTWVRMACGGRTLLSDPSPQPIGIYGTLSPETRLVWRTTARGDDDLERSGA